ncbi:hypothetical protein JQ554_31235 [Bradyrhizobium diazoefficiens]|nr:hypothetical protein [Bradyrhizobium diazoefficiens]MBR0968704.1 hypothetical protein [Bradyrhizobium diazoefficiens]MBR0981971.1 hypothetical protein [Bradyrhizobium diazoefficiens]MBR1011478.1 hypothetical protein [Bradyrhizobium diazoefficiens]MBR1017837.1 hypothetical protein [Bradyrhizobium diazoefficiens]MBR1055290.1 hypothetical protein [Bradyrhizobium diazoefficiens]
MSGWLTIRPTRNALISILVEKDLTPSENFWGGGGCLNPGIQIHSPPRCKDVFATKPFIVAGADKSRLAAA